MDGVPAFQPHDRTITANGQSQTFKVATKADDEAINKLTGGDDEVSQADLQRMQGHDPALTQATLNSKMEVNSAGLSKAPFQVAAFAMQSQSAVGPSPKATIAGYQSAIADLVGGQKPNVTPDAAAFTALADRIAADTSLPKDDRTSLLKQLETHGGAISNGSVTGGMDGKSVKAYATRFPVFVPVQQAIQQHIKNLGG